MKTDLHLFRTVSNYVFKRHPFTFCGMSTRDVNGLYHNIICYENLCFVNIDSKIFKNKDITDQIIPAIHVNYINFEVPEEDDLKSIVLNHLKKKNLSIDFSIESMNKIDFTVRHKLLNYYALDLLE